MVAGMTDDQIWALTRGGHDPQKVYAAYRCGLSTSRPAHRHPRQDGQGLRHGRGRRGPEHHPPAEEDGRDAPARVPRPLRPAADRRADAKEIPFLRFEEGSRELDYLRERRKALGGYLPARRRRDLPGSTVPPLSAFDGPAEGHRRAARSPPPWPSCASSTRCCATRTSASVWCRSCPTKARTFGMEGMFRQFGIFSQVGQLYRPEDANQLMFYKEDKSGQILQEGINEAGRRCRLGSRRRRPTASPIRR